MDFFDKKKCLNFFGKKLGYFGTIFAFGRKTNFKLWTLKFEIVLKNSTGNISFNSKVTAWFFG